MVGEWTKKGKASRRDGQKKEASREGTGSDQWGKLNELKDLVFHSWHFCPKSCFQTVRLRFWCRGPRARDLLKNIDGWKNKISQGVEGERHQTNQHYRGHFWCLWNKFETIRAKSNCRPRDSLK